MSDPHINDPRFESRPDPATRRDPVLQGNAGRGATWAWVGGIAAAVLIAILALSNWHSGTDTGTPVTANNPPLSSPAGSTGPVRNVTPPSTTGSGATAPAPAQQ